MPENRTPDVVIIGGGAIGLSAAYRLAQEGAAVTVLERGEPGSEASWAGAGMLYGGDPARARGPLAKLMALSSRMHADWSARLREFTGIDNGWMRCGGLVVGSGPGTDCRPDDDHGDDHGESRVLSPAELRELEPEMAAGLGTVRHFPETAQVRNPRHLKALSAACAALGVVVRTGCPVARIAKDGGRVIGAETPEGLRRAGAVLVAAGPWSQALLAETGIAVRTKPVRGQIVLLSAAKPLLRSIVEVGPRYLVPRGDGRLLVGSTEEDAGFEKRNTPEGVAGLLEFAARLVPAAAEATFERAWSGLRPGNADGRPYIGACESVRGLFVAAGHFRNGLQMSTGTAAVITDLIVGRAPAVPLADFRPERHS